MYVLHHVSKEKHQLEYSKLLKKVIFSTFSGKENKKASSSTVIIPSPIFRYPLGLEE